MTDTVWIDRTLGAPALNLALDEALFMERERGIRDGAVLRLWESPSYFVVVGLSGRLAAEVDVAACAARSLPVLRRISGGGTVVQGPGCLNYSLIAPLDWQAELASVSASYAWILGRIAAVFPEVAIEHAGLSDLAWQGRKVSGNAQKRGRRALLHHGTLLYNFDLAQIAGLLPHPPREPGYRGARLHGDFLANLPLSRAQLARGLRAAVGAAGELLAAEIPDVRACAAQRYEREAWNRRL